MRAIGPLAFAQCFGEIGNGPAADAGLGMRRDVRAVERAERRLQRAPAGVRRRVLAVVVMPADAAARLGQVSAALRVALGRDERGAQEKKKPRERGASRESQSLLFLAEALVAAAAALADRADLRLDRGFVAALCDGVELVRLVLQAGRFLELVRLLVDRRQRRALH